MKTFATLTTARGSRMNAGGPPLRSVQGWDSQMPPTHACGTTEEVPKAHGLQNISRQILVLHNIRQHLAHIIRVDDNVLALFLRSVKAQLIQHPLHNRVQPPRADVFRVLVDAEGKPRNLIQRLRSELQLHALRVE